MTPARLLVKRPFGLCDRPACTLLTGELHPKHALFRERPPQTLEVLPVGGEFHLVRRGGAVNVNASPTVVLLNSGFVTLGRAPCRLVAKCCGPPLRP